MTGEFAIAVHALVCLDHRRTTLSSEMLSESICTNAARIRKVMAKLKKAGLVITKEGTDGGYLFCGDASSVTLRVIDEAVGVSLLSPSWHSKGINLDCMIASGMADVMDEIYNDLNEACKKKLESVTIADLTKRIFAYHTE